MALGCTPHVALAQQIDRVEHRGTREIVIGPRSPERLPKQPPVPSSTQRSTFESARLLLQEGRFDEAERLLRRAALDATSRREAAKMLWSMLDDRAARGEASLPVDDRRESELRSMLPPGFARFESRHVVVFSDATTERVHATLGTLERTRSNFLRFARRIGLSPVPERSKSLCVVFATREGYIQFARTHDGLDASHLGGHYAPARERMLVYVDAPDHPPSEALTLRAMHEAAHMVSFRTLTQSVRRAQPFWLSEGLASAFEATSVIGTFGPDVPRSEVRLRLERLIERGEALPLRALIGQRTAPLDDPSAAGAMYLQSEALVRYLVRHRRTQLSAYMHALATDGPPTTGDGADGAARWSGHRTQDELIAEFVAHFGDPAQIERDLLRRPW